MSIPFCCLVSTHTIDAYIISLLGHILKRLGTWSSLPWCMKQQFIPGAESWKDLLPTLSYSRSATQREVYHCHYTLPQSSGFNILLQEKEVAKHIAPYLFQNNWFNLQQRVKKFKHKGTLFCLILVKSLQLSWGLLLHDIFF